MSTQISVIQPNAITNARYDYTQMQKDFLYHYIEAMQKHMTKERVLERDLFGAITIELDMKDICKSNNHAKVLTAIKDLQKRPISYHYNRDNETYDVSAVLVAAVIHKRNTGKLTIKTTEESLPYIMWLGEGFTAFNKAIALSLPSVYAKRLYEICCRWKDKGFYRVKVDEFRLMMNVEDKYKKISELRDNVLDVSQKILEEQADIKFTYEFRKENRSRSFNWIEFKIELRYGDESNKENGKYFQKVYAFLYQYYKNSRAMEVTDFLTDKFQLKKAAERFGRLQKDINKGKVRPHGVLAYITTLLYDEFEVPDELTGRGKAKKEREKLANLNIEAEAEKKAKAEELKKKKEAERKSPENFQQNIMSLFGNEEDKKRTGEKTIKEII